MQAPPQTGCRSASRMDRACRGVQGGPQVLDFAVTSGMRPDIYRAVVDSTDVVFERYEEYKRSYKQTEQSCKDQGLQFSPMVLEAQGGGWSAALKSQVEFIARGSAVVNSEDMASVSLRIAQRVTFDMPWEHELAHSIN